MSNDPTAEQIGKWRKALAETGLMRLEPHGKNFRMVSAPNSDLASLYNWLADIDASERVEREMMP